MIGEASSAVASAVEEQRVVTREISGSINSVSQATSAVSSAVGEVSATAQKSHGVTKEVSSAAGMLADHADGLRTHIDSFLEQMRA